MTTMRFSRLARGKGGLVTAGTVVALLLGIGATVFGIGAVKSAIANYDASSWLWSTNKGEVARVNGVTGRVDTRYKVADATGHTVQVTQNDRYVILRDLTTGKVSVLDLSSLQLSANSQTTAGLGVTVALHGDAAFVIDSVQGIVTQLNPSTLVPVGQPLRFMPGISGGTFDADGRLWVLVSGEGTVVAVEPTTVPAKPNDKGGSGGAATGAPKVVRTEAVAEPSHDLAISVLDNGVAVLDKTAAVLTTLHGDQVRKVSLKLTGPGALPARTDGGDVPVTVIDDRNVYVVTGDKVAQFRVPGDSPRLKPCLAWSGRFYCADEATGSVYVLDSAGHLSSTIAVPNAAGSVLELEVRENHLFVNSPNTSNAEVVDDHGRIKLVDKYANNILGGEPPPPVPPPPPQKPPVTEPGAPAFVRAAASNGAAHLTWGPAPANGAAIMKYVVEGDGKAHEVGADQRGYDVVGLTNGQSYTFTVYAVNTKGTGPKKAANPVVPTSEVPDPPAGVTATENKDGTVTVTWPPANGQGHQIAAYQVASIPAAPKDQTFNVNAAGNPNATTLAVPDGGLTYGTQYAFTVVAVNDKGATSKPSPVSNTVVPYKAPDAPTGLRANTVTNQRGAIQVAWQPAKDNGRPVTRYVLTTGTTKRDVTGTTNVTVNQLPDDTNVPVSVVAINAAGDGKAAQTNARTLAKATFNITGQSAALNSITVNLTADAKGGQLSCTLSVAGAGSANNSCDALTVGGLWPGNTYTYTLTVTNAAGGDAPRNGNIGTPALFGNVHCQGGPVNCSNGVGVYSNSRQQQSEGVGDARNGQRYQAFCKKVGTKGDQQGSAELYAAGSNNNKRSTMWVQIPYGGNRRFIPFIWINLENGDNIDALPDC